MKNCVVISREGQICLFFQKKWSFDLKKWGSFVLQQIRKVGYFRVARLQFLRRDQRRLRLPRVAVDSQPWGLSMAIFSYLLQQKFALIFRIKQPRFWKKIQICASLLLSSSRKLLRRRRRRRSSIDSSGEKTRFLETGGR